MTHHVVRKRTRRTFPGALPGGFPHRDRQGAGYAFGMRQLLAVFALALIGCGSDDAAANGSPDGGSVVDGGNADGTNDGATSDGAGDSGKSDAALGAEWLVVKGNKIVHADDTPFRGRGVNFHDERSCEACAFAPANPAGID